MRKLYIIHNRLYIIDSTKGVTEVSVGLGGGGMACNMGVIIGAEAGSLPGRCIIVHLVGKLV